MNMRLTTIALGGALALALTPPAGAADSMSLNGFRHHVLPVLVTVDSHGKITRMDPAYDLLPKVKKSVRRSVDAMVTGPAMWKHKPIASQMIINLALDAQQRDDGNYDVRWVYAGKQAVPYDPSWFWNHIDGHRLALQSSHGMQRHRIRDNGRPPHANNWRPTYRDYSRSNPSQPATTHQAPARSTQHESARARRDH